MRVRTAFGDFDVNPTHEEVKRNRRRIVMFILFIVINMKIAEPLMKYGDDFLVTLKPAYDVEYLMSNGVWEGMHVSGRVPYVYDSFAVNEHFKYDKVNAYYYAVPAVNGMVILYVPEKKNGTMEKLLEETITFLETGVRPRTVVEIEGSVVKAQGRLPYLLTQYMAEIGYTQEEIAAMGEPLMIMDNIENMQKARLYVPLAVLFGAVEIIVIVFIVLRKKAKGERVFRG